MCCIRRLLSIFFLGFFGPTLGQDNFTAYFEPDIALNFKVVPNYSHNFKISQRSYTYREDTEFQARQIDVSHFSNLKIGGDQSLAFGIQYRFRKLFEEDKENELRFTQQYNITSKPRVVRFGHRLRTEQRINPSLTTYRFRYRFAIDFPLQGEKLDLGETYFIVSTESLLSAAISKSPQYDQRFTTTMGWWVAEKTKLQAGVEYRFEDYVQATENVFFILTSLVLSL